jgi:hypothetical protein
MTRQQLRWTPADSTGVITAQVSAVVREELKQCQIVVRQLPAQEEVALQPAVKVLDQTAGPHYMIGCRPGANGSMGSVAISLCIDYPADMV